MLNPQFMQALAQLESVSCTQAEKDTINAVRGRYVAEFAADHPFVDTLARLEAVAATESEKDEINAIRGKFGLFEYQAINDLAAVTDNESRSRQYETPVKIDKDVLKNNLATSDEEDPVTADDFIMNKNTYNVDDSVQGMLGDTEEETPWFD